MNLPSGLKRSFDVLLGRPLAGGEEKQHRLGVLSGVAALGLDALSSCAYGPEAALAVLAGVGWLAPHYAMYVLFAIVALLVLLYVSYLQTIQAYPGGGGAYTVARENLGERAGLLAAAALLLDYVLTVAVGISAGVGSLVSAVPQLHSYTLVLCLAILTLLTFVNLRGVRESGQVFALPTYLFIFSLAGILGVGVVRVFSGGAHPLVAPHAPPVHGAAQAAGLWLLLRSFASGCTAMTGVEAVSNGVPYFAEPASKRARLCLSLIVGILAALLLGIAVLCRSYDIVAMNQELPGYRSVLAQTIEAVAGRGFIYYVAITATLAVLMLSANTSFVDFPRVCHLVAMDNYLPYAFGQRGRRLVYSLGILALAALAAVLLLVFRGITDRLIPLFAVGAFMAFSLSQAGMVEHWRHLPPSPGQESRRRYGRMTALALNATGALATTVALGVILVAKFVEGAWITMVVIPALLLTFRYVRRRYEAEWRSTQNPGALKLLSSEPPLVLLPVKEWSRPAERALRFGLRISRNVQVVHVAEENESPGQLREPWRREVEAPLRQSGIEPPEFVELPSPYRQFLEPLLAYVDKVECENPHRMVAVVIPELVVRTYGQFLMHNHRAQQIKDALYERGDRRVIVISVPWYLPEEGLYYPSCRLQKQTR